MRSASKATSARSLARRDARAAIIAALLLALSGCARSAIEYRADEGSSQSDTSERDADAQGTEDADEPAQDEPDGVDAAFEQIDASTPPHDANGDGDGGADASSDTPGDSGASTPADASMAAPQDASSNPSDANSSAPPDAGGTSPEAAANGACNVASCTNDCAISGPLRCCTERDTCGCSWAPGAYCL